MSHVYDEILNGSEPIDDDAISMRSDDNDRYDGLFVERCYVFHEMSIV